MWKAYLFKLKTKYGFEVQNNFLTCQNLSKLGQPCSNCLDLPKLAETCRNLPKLAETCPNLPKLG